LGNAKAQYEVGELLINIQDESSHFARVEIANKMQACATEQIYPDANAALEATAWQKTIRKNYQQALFYAHQGIKAGNETSAHVLRKVFYSENPNSHHKQWGIPEDKERSRRYKIIFDYLNRHAHLKPELNVHDLDDIVPLPPAKLPSWDGKIAIQRFEEGPAPAKPSDELVRRLAQQAGLDPNTGLPK